MSADSTVHLRPGIYERVVMESQLGKRLTTAWVREDNRGRLDTFRRARLEAYGGRELYLVRAIVRPQEPK